MDVRRTSHWRQRIAVTIVFSAVTVSVASAQTPQASGVTVRESDSLVNGALISAGVGVASGLGFCTLMEPWEELS